MGVLSSNLKKSNISEHVDVKRLDTFSYELSLSYKAIEISSNEISGLKLTSFYR